MDSRLHELDWSLIAGFVAVAEAGSLSGAARTLGSTQPTLGRQIKSLEDQLGVTLFHRHRRGFSLTDTGTALVPAARAMREAANALALTAAGQTASLAGTVRVTASVAASVYHLPQIIAGIRAAEPEIVIELVASDDTRNLLYREADIAVRMYQPTQLDLVTRHLGELSLGMYASKSYVAKRGVPTGPDDLRRHDFVGYDSDTRIIDGFRDAGMPIDRDFFAVRCDDNIAYWELVRAGCGIGFAQRYMGDTDPDIVEVDMGFPLPTLPVWLTAHQAMRQTPRIKRVWDLLVKGVKPLVS
jgi:DNA-binding transcriptional LysR family regulator